MFNEHYPYNQYRFRFVKRQITEMGVYQADCSVLSRSVTNKLVLHCDKDDSCLIGNSCCVVLLIFRASLVQSELSNGS